eukprot:7020623-Ditylum_brightwellii.AAC.1
MFNDDKEEDFGENENCGTLVEEDVEEEDATPVPLPAEADFATALFSTGVFLVDYEEYEYSLPCFLAAHNACTLLKQSEKLLNRASTQSVLQKALKKQLR